MIMSNTEIINITGQLTKARMQETADAIVAEASENTTPLDAYVRLKYIQDTCAAAMKRLAESALEEREKYGREAYSVHGCRVDGAQKSTWDYSQCGDREYNRLLGVKQDAEARLKLREKRLQAMRDSETLVDRETGEAYEVFPPARLVTEYIKVTLS